MAVFGSAPAARHGPLQVCGFWRNVVGVLGDRSMQLGFVSAILPDLSLDEVLAFAADEGFACVEVMCWPPGAADRRYAGVMHLDVTNFTDDHAGRVRDLVKKHGVVI